MTPTQSSSRYDLVVIGLGSAGLSAVDLAADQLGVRVAAIERDRIGGDCLWTGCVPSKALVASANAAHAVRRAGRFGVETGSEPVVDRDAVWRRIHDVQAAIAAEEDSPDRVRATGADLFFGEARLTDTHEVTVTADDGERRLTTSFVLVATGSRAAVPSIAGIDRVEYATSDTLFAAPPPDGPLTVVGAGPVGVEIAQAMQRLGVAVTLLEAAPRVLPREEPELTDRLTRVLTDDGVDVRTGVAVDAADPGDGTQRVVLRTDSGTVRTGAVVLATGRRPNLDRLGLDDLGVHTTADGVVVDDRNRTSLRHIYAVGDVAAGRPSFTHTAAYDASLAVRDMFLPGAGRPPATIPWCTFTNPELARVGLTADEARARFGDRTVGVHRRDLARNDRARADDATEGLLMAVTAGRRIVGAHVLAPAAGEMIGEFAVAIDRGLGLGALGDTVHPYPTTALDIGRLGADTRLDLARRLGPLARLTARWRRR